MGCGFSKPPEIETALEPLSATVDLFFKEVIGNFVAVNLVEDAVYNSKITVKFIYDSVKQEWVQGASEPSHIISNFIGMSGRNVLEKLNEVVVVGDNEAKPSIINNSSHAKVYPGNYSLNRSLIYSLTHLLNHTRSFTHSLTDLLTHSRTINMHCRGATYEAKRSRPTTNIDGCLQQKRTPNQKLEEPLRRSQ